MSVDAHFDEDDEFDIIFVEKCDKISKNLQDMNPFREEDTINFTMNLRYPHECFRKICFRQKYTSEMSLDSVFNGDHESAIILMKICT